jgi:hypothetical protein
VRPINYEHEEAARREAETQRAVRRSHA